MRPTMKLHSGQMHGSRSRASTLTHCCQSPSMRTAECRLSGTETTLKKVTSMSSFPGSSNHISKDLFLRIKHQMLSLATSRYSRLTERSLQPRVVHVELLFGDPDPEAGHSANVYPPSVSFGVCMLTLRLIGRKVWHLQHTLHICSTMIVFEHSPQGTIT